GVHQRALGKRDALHKAGHARPHFDGVDGLEVAGEFVSVRCLALNGESDGDLWWRWRWRGLPARGDEQCGTEQDGAREPSGDLPVEQDETRHTVRLHGLR